MAKPGRVTVEGRGGISAGALAHHRNAGSAHAFRYALASRPGGLASQGDPQAW
jgi:hypothetical protein